MITAYNKQKQFDYHCNHLAVYAGVGNAKAGKKFKPIFESKERKKSKKYTEKEAMETYSDIIKKMEGCEE